MAEFIENLQTKAPWEGTLVGVIINRDCNASEHARDSQPASEPPAQGKRSLVDGGNDDGPIAAHLFTGEGSLYVHTTGKFLGFFLFFFFSKFCNLAA